MCWPLSPAPPRWRWTASALDGEQIVVGIFVVVRYGCAISDVAKKVQKNVHTALEGMTGFKVAAVNVHVGGISFN